MSAAAVAAAATVASVGAGIYSATSQAGAAQDAKNATKEQTSQSQMLQGLDKSAANGLVSPWIQSGYDANSTLAGLLGIQSPDSLQKPERSQFESISMAPWGQWISTVNEVAYQQAMREYNARRSQLESMRNNGTLGSLLKPYDMEQYKQDPGYTPMVNSLEELQATPGYQFQLQQGLQSVNNSAAAKGSLLSGNSLKAVNDYAQGAASTGFQQAWERAQNAYNSAFARNQANKASAYNMLSGVSGSGQTAANTAAGFNMQNAQMTNNTLQNNSNALQNASYQSGQAASNGAAGINQAVRGGLQNYSLGQYLNNRSPYADPSNPGQFSFAFGSVK